MMPDPRTLACHVNGSLPIRPYPIPKEKSTSYLKGRAMKAKDLSEDDHSVGEEIMDGAKLTHRLTRDKKPAPHTTGEPQSRRGETRLRETSNRGAKIVEINAECRSKTPISARMRKGRVRFAEKQNQ
ncbi:uncharacterized protein EI90DRAFT_3021555 [Cantharellus anzutake]|uniref:uncharacterized protein n=1 Tax=Cantharellus anzutake TaxID=1750568 RepID=UPI0019088D8B|nr:uncharacterized protein EI90DRAFT_3021555 [Cantharellus anzutake]KAF8316470.1 hypothetical protein EI90DRAFT_3021555 [Cantharellus anzutake]